MIAKDEMHTGKEHENLCQSLQQVAKDIDCVQEESKKIQDHKGRQVSTWSLARDTSSEKLPNMEVSNNMWDVTRKRKGRLKNSQEAPPMNKSSQLSEWEA
ncbi:hypothetical protein CQW23_06740 [Capsicum baccatum]|uniref:Uncharacterized protein n=1 Tax=Capsicum baccatum TaxID=33114 RepID=A0A2G2X458_CAPBA|nr:hypothetical protein CQW23_06740 [Capsicum baccatum]